MISIPGYSFILLNGSSFINEFTYDDNSNEETVLPFIVSTDPDKTVTAKSNQFNLSLRSLSLKLIDSVVCIICKSEIFSKLSHSLLVVA